MNAKKILGIETQTECLFEVQPDPYSDPVDWLDAENYVFTVFNEKFTLQNVGKALSEKTVIFIIMLMKVGMPISVICKYVGCYRTSNNNIVID
jgi:hypothetical protein